MRTFTYKGDGDSLIALGSVLKKGVAFSTEDPALIELLSHSAKVEEVQESKEESKKTSRKSDADQS